MQKANYIAKTVRLNFELKIWATELTNMQFFSYGLWKDLWLHDIICYMQGIYIPSFLQLSSVLRGLFMPSILKICIQVNILWLRNKLRGQKANEWMKAWMNESWRVKKNNFRKLTLPLVNMCFSVFC